MREVETVFEMKTPEKTSLVKMWRMSGGEGDRGDEKRTVVAQDKLLWLRKDEENKEKMDQLARQRSCTCL